MVNDTTVEKLADLMNENPTGLLQMRDELTGLLAGWERSGHEQDRAFHLEAWNGNGSMTIDRIGRGTTHVSVICESLFGGIQPAKLLPYLQAATGYENDGFVQRLQVAVFPDPAPWEYGDDYPDKVARDRAFMLIQAIADADFKNISFDADDYNRFPYTHFTSDAQDIFRQWLTEWEETILPNETGLLLGQDLRTRLHASWDFEQLNHRYEQFLTRFRPELEALRAGGEIEPRRAFVTYLDVVNTWRQLAYRDPGLPAEVFDETWSAPEAGRLYDQLIATVEGRALAHAAGHW